MNQPYTVFAVAQLDAAVVNDGATNLLLYGDDGGNYIQLATYPVDNPDSWRINAGANVRNNPGTADSDWNVWTAVFNGASSQFWHNGVSEAAGDAGANAIDGATIGSTHLGAAPWKGDVTEILYYDANLSDADKNQVGQYLADRYGLGYTSI